MIQHEPLKDEHVFSTDAELRLRADLTHLPIARQVAATIAIREDFDLDTVEDVKLAVDEMCSTLIVRAVPGTVLSCRFQVSDGVITLLGSVLSATDQPVDQQSFGWRVLRTLTDTVDTWLAQDDTGDGEGFRIHIELTKAGGAPVPQSM